MFKNIAGGATTLYVHDVFGNLAAEYTNTTITPACTTCYFFYDYLGSLRLVTDRNANVITRHDFLPYGEEIVGGDGARSGQQFGAATNINQRFTARNAISKTARPWTSSMRATSDLCWRISPALIRPTRVLVLQIHKVGTVTRMVWAIL